MHLISRKLAYCVESTSRLECARLLQILTLEEELGTS